MPQAHETEGGGKAQAAALADTPKMAARNVNFFYGETQALFDVGLSFPEKRLTALIGTSGCGKSTLLRCLNRMNALIPGPRAEGTLTLDDEDVNAPDYDVARLRRRVGMVLQRPPPFRRPSLKTWPTAACERRTQ